MRSCSPNSGRTQIIHDHLHFWNAEWTAKHTAAVYDHVAILLAPMWKTRWLRPRQGLGQLALRRPFAAVRSCFRDCLDFRSASVHIGLVFDLFSTYRLVPFAHEGRRWTYRNAKAVPWPKLSEGLAALDSTARTDGMLVTDLATPRNVLVQNGTGIILDFDLHRAWGRDLFAPALAWLGCAGCSSSQEGQLTQPRWCTHINFCSQVRLSPYLNLYGNADTARSIHANRASLQTIRSGRGQAAQGEKARPARGANPRARTRRTLLPK